MKTTFIHVTDPPVTLTDGAHRVGERFVGGGALYGRVLFTEHLLVNVVGRHVLIQDCVFETSHTAMRLHR